MSWVNLQNDCGEYWIIIRRQNAEYCISQILLESNIYQKKTYYQ